MMLRICGLFALMMIIVISPLRADFTSFDKVKLDEIIRTYIEENPEVIRDALQHLANREEKAQKLAALAFLEMGEGDPVLGNPQGLLTIYEFSDYNCGYCKRMFGFIQEVLAEDDDLRIVVKEFPILSQSSMVAAQAAIAAQIQGVFPHYHLTMMNNPGAISIDTILAAAHDAGADTDQLQRDMRSAETAAIINRTRLSAEQLKISGTPGLVIGSTIISGAISSDDLRQLIAEERARQG